MIGNLRTEFELLQKYFNQSVKKLYRKFKRAYLTSQRDIQKNSKVISKAQEFKVDLNS